MNFFYQITKLSTYLTVRLPACLTVTLLLTFSVAQGQIISPSAQELNFSYRAQFKMPTSANESTDLEKAKKHAAHLFGLFQTQKLIKKYKIPGEMPGGIGAPPAHGEIKILASETLDEDTYIAYENSGRMLFHNRAAKALLEKGFLDIPMPLATYEIYDKKCTDAHYSSFDDYWYFYDIFRPGCEYLAKAPLAQIVRITLNAVTQKKMAATPKLPLLRGNNKNGSLFLIYAIHGFESGHQKDDSGRINFNEFNDYLTKNGFQEERIGPRTFNQLNIYKKQIRLDNGQLIDVEVRHLLASTAIESGSVVFAKFFKEAVETGDVILYGGHSGLGGNLDLTLLQEKSGAFNFAHDKKQIFFFDSCSSYSYYLQTFAAEKTKAKIDVISYGLSSYFHTSNAVWSALVDRLLDPNSKDVLWSDILFDMETVLDGDTYLLNVGGI